MSRRLLPLALAALLALAACSSSDMVSNLVGGATAQVGGDRRVGSVIGSLAGSATESVRQVGIKFSPEQEYLVGRAVAATAIARWGLDPDEARQAYVRTVGAAIVRLSTRLPETYGGWTFGVLDSAEVNGVSGPGGFVLLTRGAVDLCADEDELAAVLAHEMAHVSLKHGEKTLREGERFQGGIAALATAAAAAADEQSLRSDFSRFLGDVAEEASRTAMEHSYGRGAEFEADRESVLICYDAGYTGSAMRDCLLKIAARPGHEGSDTHATAEERAAALATVIAEYGGPFDGGVGREARAARFREALSR
jgi:predicted Zn-dependent protease